MSAVSSSQLLCQKVFWLLLLANARNTRSKSSALNRPFFGSHLLRFFVITFKLFGLPDWLSLIGVRGIHTRIRRVRLLCWLGRWLSSCGYFGVYYCALLCSVEFVSSTSSLYNLGSSAVQLRHSCLQVRKINLVIIAIRTEAFGSYITSAILLTLTLWSTVSESRTCIFLQQLCRIYWELLPSIDANIHYVVYEENCRHTESDIEPIIQI